MQCILKIIDIYNYEFQELDEFYGNVFYVKEPPELSARIVFGNKNRAFKPIKEKNKNIVLTNLKSRLLLRESTEANIQVENELCSK